MLPRAVHRGGLRAPQGTHREELYGETDSQEQVVKARKESLTASIRRTVEAEVQSERAELETVAAELQDRELAVTAREKKVSPSYRAAFLTAGAFIALLADILVRLVA